MDNGLFENMSDALQEKKENAITGLRNSVNKFSGMIDTLKDGLEALRFDPDKMSIAYLAIYDGFKKLSETIRQINVDTFGQYITDSQAGTKGSAIDVETLSDTFANLWHNAVDVRLDDFIDHYQEWSEVMTLVESVNKKYVEEAEALYGAGFENTALASLFTYTGKTVADIGVTLNYDDRKAARALLRNGISAHDVDTGMNSLNEDQRRYLDQEATQYAIDNARRYQRAMEAYLSGEKELPRWITQLSPIYRRALASHCGISGDGVE